MSGKQFVNVVLDGVARLADVAPTEMIVLHEATDWLLVGGDFAEAVGEASEEVPGLMATPEEELV